MHGSIFSQSYSPCEGCVSELIEFKKRVGVDVKVKLNYAGLFNAHRVSCIECSEFNKTNKKRKHDYKPCTESTKELIINKKRKKKIYIRPFSSFEDWQKLSSAINDCQDLDGEWFNFALSMFFFTLDVNINLPLNLELNFEGLTFNEWYFILSLCVVTDWPFQQISYEPRFWLLWLIPSIQTYFYYR